jgi:quercetin dioxygenase-like cupin family protein
MSVEVPRLTVDPGTVLRNPVTGELGRPLELGAERLVAELVALPGGAVAGPHRHPRQTERFEVLHGVMGVRRGDERFELRAGQEATVDPGLVHDWWNAGPGELRARVTVTPPGTFVEMIGAVWGLAVLGRTDAKGKPGLLDTALLLEAFGQDIVFERPPEPVQRLIARLLAPVARRRGRSVTDPRLLRAAIAPASAWPAAPPPVPA